MVLLATLVTRDVRDLGDLELGIGLRSDRHKELLFKHVVLYKEGVFDLGVLVKLLH